MPEVLMMANLSSLMSGTMWLLFASRFGLPVSTSHSLIGAMMGCGIAMGTGAVNWHYMSKVICSWLLSPVISLLVGMVYYVAVRHFILRAPDPVKVGRGVLWILLFALSTVFSLFFVFANPLVLGSVTCRMRDANNVIVDESPCVLSRWMSAHPGLAWGIALGTAVLGTAALSPFAYIRATAAVARLNSDESAPSLTDKADHACAVLAPSALRKTRTDIVHKSSGLLIAPHVTEVARSAPDLSADNSFQSAGRGAASEVVAHASISVQSASGWRPPWEQDLHADAYKGDLRASELASLAETFDPRAEAFFTTLQIISASVACLVHGSNDVSNAAAPYGAVYSIYRDGMLTKDVPVPIWVLVLSGAAISVGLTFLGHRVIKKVGIRLLHITPSRGFCIELAMSTVMLFASFLGIPLSTTHVAVGAMVGVGLMDRHFGQSNSRRRWGLNFSALNWPVLGSIGVAWLGTIVICGIVSGFIFSFALYSPTLVLSRYQTNI